MLRVEELVKRELGAIIQRDYAFDGAMVTISAVSVAPNLRNASVFFSVIGDPSGHHKIERALNRDHGAIQKKLTSRVTLKYTPQLRFKYDDSVERGVKTLSVIQELDELMPEEGEEFDDDPSEAQDPA